MLTGQTGLPPNQPTDLKMKNMHNFGIFQPIWLKLGMTQCTGRRNFMRHYNFLDIFHISFLYNFFLKKHFLSVEL